MDLSLIILGALCFTSIVMAGALAIAWASLGTPRHAASWAAAFGITAVQALFNALAIAVDGSNTLFALAFLLLTAGGPLVAIGVRQRAGLSSRWRYFLAAVVIEGAFLVTASFVPLLDPIGFASAPAFSAVFLFVAAWMLLPRDRAAQPAEKVLAIALVALGAVELAGAVPTGVAMLWPQESPTMRLYRAVLALGIPPAVICAGVAAILLVASDLASDLRRLAARDPLTGLLNRRGFLEGAVGSLANARRLHAPATIVLADIDHFKAINDKFGHTAGDRVLCFLGERLAGGMRQGDLVARIGGEEFAMLLVADALDDAREAVERIRRAIELGYEFDGAPVPVTASFGVAQVPLATGDLDTIVARALDRADRALYLSKMQGRNRVTVDGASLPLST